MTNKAKNMNDKVDTSKLGTIHELKAIIFLLEKGYDVFKNVKSTGKADLIAWCPETLDIRLIDVKTVRPYRKADGTIKYTSSINKKHDGIYYLGYIPEEDRFIWL